MQKSKKSFLGIFFVLSLCMNGALGVFGYNAYVGLLECKKAYKGEVDQNFEHVKLFDQ